MTHLRNLIYWNQQRMVELYEQASPPRRRVALDEAGVKVRTGVLDLDGRVKAGSRVPPSPLWTNVLDVVVDGLRDRGQLAAMRPCTLDEYRADPTIRYVYEFTRATRVQLPVSASLREMGFPPELRVWVADPPPRTTPPRHEWDFFGSYLLLVEELDPGPLDEQRSWEGLKLFMSGCSALHRLLTIARGDDELSRDDAHRNGRGSEAHPLEKLAEHGAHTSLPRDIEVLYQMRWMTDEQGGWDIENRVHDLLGYPLAILV